MLKSYDELRKIDVRKYCEEREGFLYLNWARCTQLLQFQYSTCFLFIREGLTAV